MEVKFEIRIGSLHTYITIDGYKPLIDKLVEAIKNAAKEYDHIAEVK